MPRLGENDSTNAKVYDPTDKKSSFENMIFEPHRKINIVIHTDGTVSAVHIHALSSLASGGRSMEIVHMKASTAEF